MKSLLAFLFAILSLPAFGQATLTFRSYSFHFPSESSLNSKTFGGGLEYGFPHNLWIVSEDFINSNRRNTLVIGGAWVPLHLGFVHAGGTLGFDLTRGYIDNPVRPLIGDMRVIVQVRKHIATGIDILPAGTGKAKIALSFTMRVSR